MRSPHEAPLWRIPHFQRDISCLDQDETDDQSSAQAHARRLHSNRLHWKTAHAWAR